MNFKDHINRICKCVDDHGGWVFRIVFWALMNSSLSQERSPTYLVSSLNVSSWVVSYHKEATISELGNHNILNIFENCLSWFAIVVLVEVESMSFAMVFKHIVEWSKSHSRPMIASSEGNIIMSSKIGRKFESSSLFLMEYVMNNFKGLFVWVDIVECKNSSDLLPPIMISSGKRVPSKSFLNSLCHLLRVLPMHIESQLRMFSQKLSGTMENRVEFVSCNIISDSHIIHYVCDFERSCE